MKKILFFLLLISLTGCGEQHTVIPTPCVAEMQVFFSKDLRCNDPGAWEVHLLEAEFEGQLVYFQEIICIYCGVAPITSGYNCSKEKVEFKDSNLLKKRSKGI
ncbi:MAG: hypothetical protein LRY55_10295 [Leadbetterella sp.]|nr:hypothetical protein [Leadbetterella sp.]